MKNKILSILFIGTFLLALITCKKDDDPPTGRFSINKEKEKVTVTTTSVTIMGEYIFAGKVKGMKLQLGTNEHLFGSDEYAAELGDKAYTATVTGLTPGTLYYYRYLVDYGDDIDYESDIYDFTTLSEAPTVKILAIEPLNNDSTSFRITCKVEDDGGAEVTECGICWNNYPNGNPTLDDEKQTYTGENNPYTIKMENLPTRTFYHVKAYAKSSAGTGFSEKESFRTGGEATKPKVSTVEVSGVTFNSASCLCNVSSDGGLELIERGVCWSENDNPGLTDLHLAAEGEAIMGEFSITLTNLSLDKEYYVRAYAINAKGTTLADEVLPFKTTDGKPTVTTLGITDITATSAKGSGEVTDQGASPVTERGICWSTNHEPMATGNHAANGTGVGSFTCDMTNLTPNQTYYVRAYATNSQGTYYGDEVDFVAMEGLPSVQTFDVTDVTTSSAKAHYKVTIEGGLEVIEHGICWSESNTTPTINDHYISGGNGTGTFSVDLNGLNPGTKYYVRAYAKNEQGGEAYGSAKDFTTEATLPTVTTDGIEGTTAHGTVTADGGKPVTERGICWSLNHNPTTADMHGSNGTGLGGYTVELTDLEPGKTYYYRAYATNEKGTAYGDEQPLDVEANPPTVTTGEVSNIQQTSAQGSGTVTDDGGSPVNERGVCWSTSHLPTVDGSHQQAAQGGTGSFTVNMTGLTANTHYYVRAYAKNEAGKIDYGDEVDFTTSQNISAPSVTTTSPITNITQTTAIGGGNVTNDGGAPVTERGICWSTNHTPTTSGSHASNGTGTGTYTVNMTGLTPGTTYYVRAYAINSAGTSYGGEVPFETQQQQPTTYTITVSANPSNGGSAHVGSTTGPTSGTYNQGESCTVYAVANSNYTFTNWTEGGSVVSQSTTYTFTVNSSRNLVANFTLQVTLPTVITTDPVTNIQQTTATGGGNVTNSGGAAVTARGVCWSTSSNPTINNSHTTNGTGTGIFTSSITGLTAGTLYHVRAYATNSAGTAYGADVTFTTQQVPTYTITVSANPSNGGTAHVGSPTGPTTGTFTQGQSCTIYATANEHYTFTNWKKGNSVVSTNATYTFDVTESASYTANFTQDPQYTITATANPTNGGSVSGGGTYYQGQTCNLTATPANSNYTFTNWTENGGVVSTQANYTFTVNGNRTLLANFNYNGGGNAPTGAINGQFTINSSGNKVYFSQGNLQYIGSSGTWKFADTQWEVIGTSQGNTSQTTTRDLFGWGTSRWDNGNVYYQPYDTQNNGNSSQGYGYGPTDGTSYTYDLTGTYANADWGVYNSISNGGGQAGQWRTLTMYEWAYVFQGRSGASSKYGHGKVNGQNGMILLPDEWTLPSGMSFTPGNSSWVNEYTTGQWEQMEQNGAVFLPAAGDRSGTSVRDVGIYGQYWSASCNGSLAHSAFFMESVLSVNLGGYARRDCGFTVRLVCPVGN